MNPNTYISTVVIEAPCICPSLLPLVSRLTSHPAIDLVSFMWLATGAYAEHSLESGTNCYPVPSVGASFSLVSNGGVRQ